MKRIVRTKRIDGLILTLALAGVPVAWGADEHADIRKHALPRLDAAACHKIASNATTFAAEKTSETTQYFTSMYQPDAKGELRAEDRNNCLRVEGSCIVGNYLYNADGTNGKRFDRDKVKFIFGQGTGVSKYNKTNALIPCRTLAADTSHYAIGTVIFIPAFQGKTCPQNNEPVDGCFIVGDIGSKIKGKGRFDIFTGECVDTNGNNNTCRDKGNAAFNVPPKTEFRIIPKDSDLAGSLRKEVDAFIDNGWKPISP